MNESVRLDEGVAIVDLLLHVLPKNENAVFLHLAEESLPARSFPLPFNSD